MTTLPNNGASPFESELLDVRAVARLLGCSTRTVWRLRGRGAIPQSVALSSGIVRWKRAALLRWLEGLGPAPRHSGPGRQTPDTEKSV